MAGAGYKLFNSGDVLTAAQVNTYLMEQTVMVFNDAAARTTALSGVLSEGMISYLKDTNAVEVYNGSAWVASDDPNAIQNTIVDAKGDLITATAADVPARLASSGVNGDVLTVDTSTATGLKWAAAAASSPLTTKGDLFTYSTTNARLAVGANGETLVADSSATTGLRWQADWNTGKNKIINGDFFINQRAFTSVTGGYGFDRWTLLKGGNGTCTYTPQTFSLGTAPVSGYEGKNFARLVTASVSSADEISVLAQYIESVRTFANQTITISFWAKVASGTPSVAVSIVQDFGTGGSPSSNVATHFSKVVLSTSWTRYTVTGTVPSISGKTLGTNNNDALRVYLIVSAGSDFNTLSGTLGNQVGTFEFWGVQAEAGSVATPFTTATGTLAGELAAAMRYYQKSYSQATAPATATNVGSINGINTSTTLVAGLGRFPVVMRTAPTVTLYSVADGATGQIRSGGANIAGTPTDISDGAISYIAATGLTAGSNSLIQYALSSEL